VTKFGRTLGARSVVLFNAIGKCTVLFLMSLLPYYLELVFNIRELFPLQADL